MSALLHSHSHLRLIDSRRIATGVLIGLLSGALVVLGCGPSSESQLTEVRALQEAAQFDASIAPLRKLIADEPNHPEANLRLGIALQQTGRPSLAVWPLQKASLSEEHGVQAGLLLASTLAASQSFEEALRAYRRVLERDPNSTGALFGMGQAQLSIGQPTAALETSEKLLLVLPDDQLGASLKGAALIDLDRSDEAEAVWKGVVDRAINGNDPTDAARKCAALGVFYRSQNDAEYARETFSRCILDYPLNHQLLQHASEFFLVYEEYDAAVEIWQSAIEAAPEDLTIRIRLAEILASINRTDQALKVLQESVELFDSAEAWRHLAGFLRVQGNLKAAREALEESMERSRSVAPSLRFTLADLLIEEGNYDRALSIAESLEEPSYRAMIRGAILLQQGDAAAALELLDSGLRLYPNNAGARYLAGQAALAIGETERAMAEFREAIRVSETETDAALRLAEFNFREGEYLNAIGFADRHIAKRPYVDPTAHIISARSSIIAGNYKQAEGTLSNLRLNAPTQPVSFLEFAELKRVTEGPEAALEVLLQADFDLTEPANSAMLQAVAQDFLSLGKGANALALVDEALAAHPDHPNLHDLRGRVLLSLGRQAEADTAFSSALNLDPRFAPSLEARGSYALWSGDLANALAYFEKAAQAAPSNAQYAYLQAQIHYMQSNSERAEGLFRQALELNPGHVGANNDLAWLLASQSRDLDAANDLADRAVRMDMNADTLDTLGFVRLQAGDPKAATEILRKALEQRPDSPSIEFRLGLALSASGEKKAAREMFQKALRTPDFPEAEAAKAELSNLESS